MKPIAWYDPSNDVVSADRDSPLFTPLGQVWPLYPKGEWVGLTDEEIDALRLATGYAAGLERFTVIAQVIEAKLKEKNT